MKKKNFIPVIIMLLLNAPASLYGDELKMAVGLYLPPYFLADENKGLELDIIREALKIKNHSVTPHYMPFARTPMALNEKMVDCAATVNEASEIKAFYSDSHVSYQNFAISLKKNQFDIASIGDLKDKAIIAFQDATKYLGPEFAAVVSRNTAYTEKSKQDIQTILLFAERTDIVVMDINIFKYFRTIVSDRINTSAPVAYHDLFPKTDFKVGFVSEKIRNDFNEGLLEIRKSGVYDRILKSYTSSDSMAK